MSTILSTQLINKGFAACSEDSQDRYTVMIMDVPLKGLNQSLSIEFQGKTNSSTSKYGVKDLVVIY
jgi:hypothetical protein